MLNDRLRPTHKAYREETMDVKEVLYMGKGGGENSYAKLSTFTQMVTSITKPVLQNAVQSLFTKGLHQQKVLKIADLGCSAGPNTFSVISTVKDSVEKKCKEMNCQTPELQFYLNDLPGNDFNTLFKGLPSVCDQSEGASCYAMGVPGSFYGRLLPRNSLHLAYSSYSVHWLSQVPKGLTSKEGLPLNKGNIYISQTSPPIVREAYLAQFQEDLTLFLKCRSEEMVPGARIVLILHGRQSSDPWGKVSCYPWELLGQAIAEMVSQGLIDEGKFDFFNVPYYTSSPEEVQNIVEREGSFGVEHLEIFQLEVADKEERDKWAKGQKVAKRIRSFSESFVSYQFGEEIMDKLYDKFTHLVVEDLAKESTKGTSIIVMLSKGG
ncbi:probable caffeine synthase 4 [Cornus florida]|uniref:probable caffeine synthase 4 n=1 Tax=Cornus florida TaxID=4283 RepID=UPI002899069E|nr:probable caffeine synthase 4 [Cornus florida]